MRSARGASWGRYCDALDMGRIVMRQFTGPPERPCNLQEAKTHEVGAERDAAVDDPTRELEIGRDLIGGHQLNDELRAHRADDGGEQRSAQEAEEDDASADRSMQLIDQDVDADMDAGTHA